MDLTGPVPATGPSLFYGGTGPSGLRLRGLEEIAKTAGELGFGITHFAFAPETLQSTKRDGVVGHIFQGCVKVLSGPGDIAVPF